MADRVRLRRTTQAAVDEKPACIWLRDFRIDARSSDEVLHFTATRMDLPRQRSHSPDVQNSLEPAQSAVSAIDPALAARNNKRAWHPLYRVNDFTPNHYEGQHERLQPQGGRRLGAHQSNCQRCRRASGERNPGDYQVSERRSRSRGAFAFNPRLAHCIRKAGKVRRLHGTAPEPAQVEVAVFRPQNLGTHFVSMPMLLIILIAILFLSSCSHPKQARVDVPPPPAPEATTPESSVPQPPAKPPNAEGTASAPRDGEADLAEPTIPPDTQPILTETGLASWYGPPYHNRRGSNGE